MLPVYSKKANHQKTLSLASVFFDGLLVRRLTSVSAVACIMTSMLTFVIGLAIGTMLPANTSPVPSAGDRGLDGNVLLQMTNRITNATALKSVTTEPGSEVDEKSDKRNSGSISGHGMPATKPFVSAKIETQSDVFFHAQNSDHILHNRLDSASDGGGDLANSGYQLDPAVSRLDNEGSSHRRPTPRYVSRTNDGPFVPENVSGSRVKGDARPSFVPKRMSDMVKDGIFWHPDLDGSRPLGFTEGDVEHWRNFTRHSAILKVEPGCGRMQNRKVTFGDGTQACCRYRHNNDQIQGEIFSFLLSRTLGIENVPPSTLAILKDNDWQWSYVKNKVILAQWNDEKPVVMTRFVDDVRPAFIPPAFRSKHRRLHPTEGDLLGKYSPDELSELIQWTDLIIFDYLTANLDRIVNNMFNEQWNPDMMTSPAHNLVKVSSSTSASGLLMFIDNESGLLHGYRLLDKYDKYHQSLLNSTCIFRQSTAQAIEKLYKDKNVGKILLDMFRRTEPEVSEKWLASLPSKNIKLLNKRISNVHRHIEKCRQRYQFNIER